MAGKASANRRPLEPETFSHEQNALTIGVLVFARFKRRLGIALWFKRLGSPNSQRGMIPSSPRVIFDPSLCRGGERLKGKRNDMERNEALFRRTTLFHMTVFTSSKTTGRNDVASQCSKRWSKTWPSAVCSLYVPGRSTSAMTNGPSHGGDSLWRPFVL